MRQGLYLASGLAALSWLVVLLITPGSRARALRIVIERQWVMADLGSEAYLRGAEQVAKQANIVATDPAISDGDRAARLRDLRGVALDLGARHISWQRLTSRLDAARQSVPARIWPSTQVSDPSTGLMLWTGATQEQLAAHYLKALRDDPKNKQLPIVAAHWAAPGAPPLPAFDASMEFAR